MEGNQNPRLITKKNALLVNLLYYLSNLLAVRSDRSLIYLTYLAERIVKKPYYVREIRKIRHMFKQNHPSLQVARKLLRYTHPVQRKKLIECFVINQLLVGTNKRKAFAEAPGGFYPPGFPVVSPTMSCNLNCFGCYSGDYAKESGLDFATLDNIFNQVKEMGMYFAVISGGEPFLNQNLIPIFERHNDIAFHVFTNGTLITDEVVARMMKVGNVLPAVSVEGYQEYTDLRRGKGHYQRVMEAMRRMREHGFLFGFSVTMTRDNADTVMSEDFIDFYIEQGCVLGWYFTYVPIGRKPDVNLMPTPEQRAKLHYWVTEMRAKKPILFGSFWNDGPIVGGCLAGGRKYFHINSNGDIEPCVFFHFAVDNIKTTTLKQAMQSKLFKIIREEQQHNGNLLTPCTLIDHPSISRRAVQESGAKPTHEGAELLLTELAPAIDAYADQWCKVAGPIWDSMPKTRDELCRKQGII